MSGIDATGHGITDGFVERVAYEAMRDKRDAAVAETRRLREALTSARTFVEFADYTLAQDRALLTQIDDALAGRTE